MEYLEMVLRLKSVHTNDIVLVACGAFYIAIGEDAVILHIKLNLKVSCMKKNMCKVGIPKTSIEKCIENKKINIIKQQIYKITINKEKIRCIVKKSCQQIHFTIYRKNIDKIIKKEYNKYRN